jgi:hypothetical protein
MDYERTGSPPKPEMCLWIHSIAFFWSNRPKLDKSSEMYVRPRKLSL